MGCVTLDYAIIPILFISRQSFDTTEFKNERIFVVEWMGAAIWKTINEGN